MKRIFTVLAATLLLTAAMAVSASASDYDAVAEDLSAIGVFRGTSDGFELDRAPTRSEAAIMLVRLYGAEDEAKTEAYRQLRERMDEILSDGELVSREIESGLADAKYVISCKLELLRDIALESEIYR